MKEFSEAKMLAAAFPSCLLVCGSCVHVCVFFFFFCFAICLRCISDLHFSFFISFALCAPLPLIPSFWCWSFFFFPLLFLLSLLLCLFFSHTRRVSFPWPLLQLPFAKKKKMSANFFFFFLLSFLLFVLLLFFPCLVTVVCAFAFLFFFFLIIFCASWVFYVYGVVCKISFFITRSNVV